jgi:Flp pilus assembly protein TadG
LPVGSASKKLAATSGGRDMTAAVGGSRRRGAAAAELAILLPFLALLFVAALDFGRIFFVTQTLDQCAYAGALYASGTAWASSSTGPTQAAIAAACADGTTLDPPLQDSQVDVTLTASTATVTVHYQFQLLTPVLGSAGTVALQRSVTLNLAPVPGS